MRGVMAAAVLAVAVVLMVDTSGRGKRVQQQRHIGFRLRRGAHPGQWRPHLGRVRGTDAVRGEIGNVAGCPRAPACYPFTP